ncbi:MAG: ABC transporter permease [Planctomycetia bacterium]
MTQDLVITTEPPPAAGPRHTGPEIPDWLDDESPRGRRTRRLRLLVRPLAVLAGLSLAVGLWFGGRPAQAITVLGVVALALGVVCGVAGLRRLLSAGHPVVGVARAIVEEAVGTRLSVLLVMLVVVALPTLPLVLDPSERLAYRLQFFLDWSLSGASALLALITIALSCTSVCGDIESRRIHMALSKPLRRWEYLFGKWLGVVLLDLLLVTLVGMGVYAFAESLRRSPAADNADRRAVEEQVLTARASARPVHPRQQEFDKAVEATIAAIRKDDPVLFDKNPDGARRRIFSQHVFGWHTVSPDVVSSYLFQGLGDAGRRAPVVQLRLQAFADNSQTSTADVRFALWLNERPYPVKEGRHEEYVLAAGPMHTLELPSTAIAEDGTLRVTIANRNMLMPGDPAPTSIGFNPGEGLELLYRVGSFEGNMLRALVLMWAKLAMLAAVALAAAAWLGLPVAMLASLMVFASAVASGFLADAIDIYTGVDIADPTLTSMLRLRGSLLMERVAKAEWWEAIKTVGSWAGDAFLTLIPSFGDYDAITQVATGRLVSAASTAAGVCELGVAYPLLLLALGWWLIERRDLVSSTT